MKMGTKISVARLSEHKRVEGRKVFYEGTDFSLGAYGTETILSQELRNILSCNVISPTVQYGLGAFEGIMAYGVKDKEGKYKIYIFRLKDHINRLFHSVNALKTRIDYTKEQIHETILRAAQQHIGAEKVYLRPTVRTDKKNFGIDVSKIPFQEFLVMAGPFNYLQMGLKLTTAPDKEFEKLSSSAGYIDAKITGQYANGAKGKGFSNEADCHDTLSTRDGYIAEMSGGNVMGFKGNNVVATPSSRYVFAGFTRDSLIQMLKIEKNIDVEEMDISVPDALQKFDAWQGVGTAAEVKDIIQINDVHFGPSPLSERVKKAYHDLVRGDTQHYKGHDLYKTRITEVSDLEIE